MCPPVHPSQIFVCTTLIFYKKIFSKLCMYSGKIHKLLHNFDRIIFDGIIAFFTSLRIFHQQICSWMSSFIINGNGSTLSKLAQYHMKIRILLQQFDRTIFKEFQVKFVPDKQIENIDKYVLFCSKCMSDK